MIVLMDVKERVWAVLILARTIVLAHVKRDVLDVKIVPAPVIQIAEEAAKQVVWHRPS